jgi:hypothetical protein
MVDLNLLLAIVVGIAARLVIPIFVTILAVYFLRRVDARWQKEATIPPTRLEKPACWEIKGCSPEVSKHCAGRTSPLPCWQARRTANGYLSEQCLTCTIFLKAPAPTLA